MKYSITNYKSLHNLDEFRYDPEYFSPEYIEKEKIVKNNNWQYLINMSEKITDFGAYSQNNIIAYISNGEYKFIRNQDVEVFFINTEEELYIDKSVYEKLSLHLDIDDILIQRVGSLGKASIVRKENIPSTANQNLAQIKVDSSKLNPYFLIAYLNGIYGITYFERTKTGNVQPWLNLGQIKYMPVPIKSSCFQKIIENIIVHAYKMVISLKKIKNDSNKILLYELGLLNWQPKHELSYVKNFSDVSSANRCDAEYFQPKYDEIIEKIKSYPNGWDIVGNLFDQNRDSFIIKKDNKYKYVEIGSINTSNGEITFEEILGNDLPANAKIKLHIGDVLISKVRTYRGAVAVVEHSDYIGSGAFTVLQERLNSQINKETLYTFFKLKPILDLTLKYNTGTSYPTITDEDILNMPIPIFKQNIQNEIREKFQEAKKLQTQSKQLLEIAKRGVEIAIEENEEVATSWINEQLSKIGVEL